MSITTPDDLARRRHATSPRFQSLPTPWRSHLVHGAVLLLWVVLVARAFDGGGVFAWSVGFAYIAYDALLLLFVTWQTRALLPVPAPMDAGPTPAATIIIAAHNEAAALPATVAALLAQTNKPAMIVIADDGSDDDTLAVLQSRFGLLLGATGTLSAPGTSDPSVRWLRLPRGGKARALNAAFALAETELVLTVDADTLLDSGALAAMQRAFTNDPALVVATGVLRPTCGPSLLGRPLQWFQTYEYVRNFLTRYAWMRADGLLLISGAFACYRRQAVVTVGGFDPGSLVEDYELTHRLLDYAGRHGITWHTAAVGAAHASTDAPAALGAFLRQRRRWFGGFLQTQLWYRHMVGDARYGRLGTEMLLSKAIDTMQPIFGLSATGLLLWFLARGRIDVVVPVACVIAVKLLLDLAFYLWSLRLYRRWVGPSSDLRASAATVAALIEPFSFQILRHLGAALGWVTFLTGARSWGTPDPQDDTLPG